MKTTYKGRAIRVLSVRNRPDLRKLEINGQTIQHGWQGDTKQAEAWFKQIIDRMDAEGGPGNSAYRLHYTSPHWWEPGTFDVNPKGHVTQPGGFCLCSQCVIGEVGGGKARYTPLKPDACRLCHLGPGDDHKPSQLLPYGPHRYTEPTDQQRAGRQATIDQYRQVDEDDDEATCDAIYPEQVRGYLGRPRCLYFADHRDAHDPDYHYDHRGFRWPRKAAA